MANSVQLKHVIKNADTTENAENSFYKAQIGLGISSVIISAITGKLIIKYLYWNQWLEEDIMNLNFNCMNFYLTNFIDILELSNRFN